MILKSLLDCIGDTPMLELSRLSGSSIFAKLELLNPGGSVKDRVAKFLIEEAERKGTLKPDSIIVEASSGNTGIGCNIDMYQQHIPTII